MTTQQPTETPRLDRAHKDCLDDAGNITRLEPIYEEFEKVERELTAAKTLLNARPTCRCGLSTDEECELFGQLTAAKAEIARLREILTKMVDNCGATSNSGKDYRYDCTAFLEALAQWEALKKT